MFYLIIAFLAQTALAAWVIWWLERDRQRLLQEVLRQRSPEQVILRASESFPTRSQRFPAMDDEFEAYLDQRRRRAAKDEMEDALDME